MAIVLAEGLVNDVQTYLQDNFAIKVEELNAEFDDGITLENPVAYYQSEQSLDNIPSYPVIFLLVPRTNITGWNASVMDSVHQLVIGIIVIDADTERLRKRLYRYIRAMVELLVESQNMLDWALDASPIEGQPFSADFSPIYSNNEMFMADAQITANWTNRNMEAF